MPSKRVARKPQGLSATSNSTLSDRGLQENDASFRILFVNNPQPMWVYDLGTLKFLEVNNAAIDRYGYSRDEFLGMRMTDIRPAEDVPRLLEDVATNRTGLQHSGQWRHTLRSGKLVDVEITSHTLIFGGRNAELVVVHDVTDRNLIEQALRESEERYRELIQGVKDYAIFMLSPSGHVVSWNQGAERIKGYKAGEIIGSHFSRFYPPEDVQSGAPERALQRAASDGRYEEEGWRIRKDGSCFLAHMVLTTVRDPKGELHGFSKITRDVTERKQADEALKQAEHKYRRIFENAVIGIFQSSPEGRYLTANPAIARMLGYDSPADLMSGITDIGRQLYVDPERRRKFQELLEKEDVVQNFEVQVYRKDGSKMWFSATGRAIRRDGVIVRYEGMNQDITERKLLEDQLRQAQKMEAVGRLAGGIAHDFNNMLGVITGYGELLQLKLSAGDPLQRYAHAIGKAGHSAAALTRQLLGFSRKQVINPVVLDLNAIVSQMEEMLCRLIGEDVQVTFKPRMESGLVKIDPGQVEQILMNLAVNARDAMPRGGKLNIEIADIELDETYARQVAYVTPGSYVMLSVSDTGCGMDKQTQAHIFEPFFTTKEPGKGTGLGLSTVYGIVKQNEGYIQVYSEPEKGTTFKIYFPRELGAVSTPQLTQVSAPPGGAEVILLVEDEEALRELARTCLESYGYKVLEAADATAATELARHTEQLDLLLTDVIMPGRSGRSLADQLLELRPGLKVLYMSGYAGDLVAQHGALNPSTLLLEKPFTLHSLLTKVRQALHSWPTGRSARAN